METRRVIEKFSAEVMPVNHQWQADDGFRKCTILNRAVEGAKGDYLILSDGDCIPRWDFVEQHVQRGLPGHLRHLQVAAKSGKRPIQGPGEPRRPSLVTSKRGAAPLIRSIQKPDAGEIERGSDCGDLLHVGRARPSEPAARYGIDRWKDKLARPGSD